MTVLLYPIQTEQRQINFKNIPHQLHYSTEEMLCPAVLVTDGVPQRRDEWYAVVVTTPNKKDHCS